MTATLCAGVTSADLEVVRELLAVPHGRPVERRRRVAFAGDYHTEIDIVYLQLVGPAVTAAAPMRVAGPAGLEVVTRLGGEGGGFRSRRIADLDWHDPYRPIPATAREVAEAVVAGASSHA